MRIRSTVLVLMVILVLARSAAGRGAEVPDSLPAIECRSLSLDDYRDRLRGGFVGQMAGVCYGAPYEFKFEGRTIPEGLMTGWRPEMIKGALVQDDIYVELTFLQTLEQYGLDVSLEQIGRDFGDSKYPLWHANKAARKNIRAGVMPPLSGHPRYNAHADDIDFQIEADLFGLICPAMPAAAQDLAWRFGHVMNYGDGVYGGVFIAAMYAAAFSETDRMKVVEAGLGAIPAESNYSRTIRDVTDAYNHDPSDWRSAWRVVEDRWAADQHCPGRHPLYPWKGAGIGANVNGAYVAIGLLYGRGDPLDTIKIATMCGRDADCNPASAMGVLGTMMGLSRLPEDFKSALPGMEDKRFIFTRYTYAGALAEMERQARAVVVREGGREEGETWMLSAVPLRSLPLEQWPYDLPAAEVPLPEK